VVALESQFGLKLLGHDSGMIFQGRVSCSRKLPFFLLQGAEISYSQLRGQNLAQVDFAGIYIYTSYMYM
jgi:uncharacterized protein YjbI with pentapeptide repeats